MTSTLSKFWTRASFARNCGEALMSGGSSESEQLMGGASCAVSTMKLWKQECEEGNIPEPFCPDEWQPSNNTAEVRQPRRADPHISEPGFEEQPAPQEFQKVDIGPNCPKCGEKIDYQTSRCGNCLIELDWEHGTPKVAEEKMSMDEESPFIAVQSKSSF